MAEKQIETLISDIYAVLDSGVEIAPEDAQQFGQDLSELIVQRLAPQEPRPGYLRPSNVGEKCDRKTWYQVNRPELEEALRPDTKLKFLIGDVWEHLLLFLAKASGHDVQGQQDKMELHGITGSRDAVIDGVTVDAKSASTFSYYKFAEGLTRDKDAFGYLPQIHFYREAGDEDPLVEDKDRAAFFVADKTLGKVTLDIHGKDEQDWDYEELIAHKKEMLASPTTPPRGYSDEPDGKSGNRKLSVNCSYCPFKQSCWPGLRTYLYSNGPRYLTEVVKEPNVTEVNS